MRVGNKLTRIGLGTPSTSETRPTSSPRPSVAEAAGERARRLGYVVHGEFDLKLAYAPDVLTDEVVRTIERGRYERAEGRRAEKLIEPGDRITELGAGLGFLSALIMSRFDVADYQLVEADPRLAPLIRRTHELNGIDGPATIHTCVATCSRPLIEAGTVNLHVGQKFCASSLLGSSNELHEVAVPVVSLPELLGAARSNVLICDIEGAETDVFDGTPLPTVDRILMELHVHRTGLDAIRTMFRNLDAIGFGYDPELSTGGVCGFRRP